MKKVFRMTILFALVTIACPVCAQSLVELKQNIIQITAHKKATVGVAIMGFDGKDTLTVHGDEHFPMQSVFKFPIGLTVLHQVDKNKLELSRQIKLTKKDLIPNTYSPIRGKYPKGVTLNLSALIGYAVSESDNIATDVLLDLIGGPKTVEAFIKTSGIRDISIKHNEAEQHKNWENQYDNWISPKAANLLLKTFYENKNGLLTNQSHRLIWSAMKATQTG